MTWDKIVKILAGLAGGIAGMLGEWDIMLTVLACFMVKIWPISRAPRFLPNLPVRYQVLQ